MKNRLFAPLLLSLSLLLVSCGNGGDGTNPTENFSSAEKSFVYDLFTTEYLWFDEVDTTVEYTTFDEPQALIDALRVEKDLWSFTMTEQEYENYVNQKTAGFGFRYKDDFLIMQVLIDAPAYHKLYRGDQILEINGETVTQELLSAASENLNVSTTFTVLREGEERSVNVTPEEYTFKVTEGTILNGNVGYLRYDSFTSTSVGEFEAEFTKFKASGITDLIVDLRYNGGGSVDVASSLLDNITNQYPGQRQVYLDWNINYKSNNESYRFEDADMQDGNELSLSRIFFLVTRNSASASELVISALKPYLGDTNVVTIGEATHGKPVGMSGRTYGSNYYFLINFTVRNNAEETTSLEGIPATCTAEDDFSHLMGDPQETMLSTALYYLTNNSCP